MAECKKCVSEKVCRYNDGHNLCCTEDYECPHFKNKADVVGVRHGTWYKAKDGYTRCSRCDSRGSAIKARYCHHCGAKMDGKDGAE